MKVKKINLKILVLTVLALTTFNSTIMAQKEKKHKEIKLVRTSEVINVSTDSLWEIVGPGFQHIGIWNRNIDHATGSGDGEFEGAGCSERVCEIATKGYSKLREKLILYDIGNKEIAYKVMEGLPGFVLYAQNHWTVSEVSPNKSVVKMDITMHVTPFIGTIMGSIMKKQFDKAIAQAFEDLIIYAETGEISEAKKARIEELENKSKK
ncbi:MAG: hypothetical protein COA58_15770 [Bacteroidetes bacterium]|nr:MAG: hypothetical protein COA58_15770 [Bacteroidota bacterium]